MKNLYFYLLCSFFFLLVSSDSLVAQCNITSFTADYVPNSCEGEIIEIEFDFVATDFGANGFTVDSQDGIQQYNIGDDYVYWMISYCDEDVTLTIKDIDDPNCTAEIILEPACCDCEITTPVLEAFECSGGLFDLHVEFDIIEGTCVNYNWYLQIEGVDYALDYINNGGYYEATDIQAVGNVLTVMLCNESPLNECFTYILDNPCFEIPANCSINSITAYTDTTSCQGEIIDVLFDIDAVDFGLNGFTVSDGTATELFDLNDDFSFATISLCHEDLELTFTDSDDPDCYEIITITPDCCECLIDDILVNPTSCNNGSFDLHVDILVESGSCISYDWFITVESADYDLIWNGSTYLASNVMATDSVVTAMVCTLAPSGECFTVDFINPCFVPVTNPNCMISSLIAEYDTTSCIGEIINIDFDFNATDFGADGFTISTNGQSQFYNLGDDYTFSIIADCDSDVSLTITDVQNPNCFATVTLGPACCDCIISDPVIETTDCVGGLFDLHMEFLVEQGSCTNYDWYVTVDGVDYDLEYNTTDNYFEASDILATDSLLTIMLCNESPLNECYTYTITNPCYDDNSNAVCTINSFTAVYDTTSCMGELIYIDFEFDATGFGLSGFEVSSDGYTQFYNLGDPYNIGVITLCEEDIELTITDIDDPDCIATATLGPACCPCVFEDIEIEDPVCENGTFDLNVSMIIESGTCINYDWYTNINGSSYDLEWDGNYLVAEDIYSVDSLLTIFVCTESPIYDCTVFNIENPCYDDNTACMVNSFTATVDSISCDSLGNVLVSFDYDIENPGSLGYSIAVDGVVQDTVDYPGAIEFVVPSNCDSLTTFTFQDLEFTDCNATTEVDVCCTAGVSCMIQELTIDALQSNNKIKLILNLLVDDICPTLYNVSVNGNSYGLHDINVPDYIIDDIISTEEILTVFICNEVFPEFCETIQITNPLISNTTDVLNNYIKLFSDHNGNLIVTNNYAFDLDFTLWSIQGHKLSNSSVAPNNTVTTSLETIKDGIYIVQFITSDGKYDAKKILLLNNNIR